MTRARQLEPDPDLFAEALGSRDPQVRALASRLGAELVRLAVRRRTLRRIERALRTSDVDELEALIEELRSTTK